MGFKFPIRSDPELEIQYTDYIEINQVIHIISLLLCGKKKQKNKGKKSGFSFFPHALFTRARTHLTHVQVRGSSSSQTAKPFICIPGETITQEQAAEPDRGLLGINDGLMT